MKENLEINFTKFLETFEPSYQSDPINQSHNSDLLEQYSDMLPNAFIKFWLKYGLRNFGKGIIRTINPNEYKNILYSWLGKKDEAKIPIFMTGFGDIFYYTKTNDNEGTISLLDIHYKKVEICCYSFEQFFDYIINSEIIETILRKKLFDKALEKKKDLLHYEIYFFVPALIAGGEEDIKYIDKGIAHTHHRLLLNLNGIPEFQKENTNNSKYDIKTLDYTNFWNEEVNSKITTPIETPNDELVKEIEEKLGYKLPNDYIWLMKQHNGGTPQKNEFHGTKDIPIAEFFSIGKGYSSYSKTIDNQFEFLLNEWEFPNIGVPFGYCIDGHEILYFDYRECGPNGEPKISYIDDYNYNPIVIANNFAEFICNLRFPTQPDTTRIVKQDNIITEITNHSNKGITIKYHEDYKFDIKNIDFANFWDDSEYSKENYIDNPPTDELIKEVEEKLGYKLPNDYIWLMKQHNGGILKNSSFCSGTNIPHWGEEIYLTGFYSIGKEKIYSTLGILGSKNIMEEWNCRNIGIPFCDTKSGGHDYIFFDYRKCGPNGEPKISIVDQEFDYKPTVIANNFAEFIYILKNPQNSPVTFLNKLNNVSINNDKIQMIENKYNCILREDTIKKIISFNNNGQKYFFNSISDWKSILTLDEILEASNDVQVDFTKFRIFPVIDLHSNDYICFDYQNQSWVKFNIAEELVYQKMTSLKDSLSNNMKATLEPNNSNNVFSNKNIKSNSKKSITIDKKNKKWFMIDMAGTIIISFVNIFYFLISSFSLDDYLFMFISVLSASLPLFLSVHPIISISKGKLSKYSYAIFSTIGCLLLINGLSYEFVSFGLIMFILNISFGLLTLILINKKLNK